jgi:hypothetical protein
MLLLFYLFYLLVLHQYVKELVFFLSSKKAQNFLREIAYKDTTLFAISKIF